MHLLKSVKLFVCFAFHLERHFGFLDLFPNFIHLFGALVTFSELLLNLFKLLAEEVISLRLAHFFLRLVLNTRLHGGQLEFAAQQFVDFLQSFKGIENL